MTNRLSDKAGRAGVEIGSEQLDISLLEFRFAWQKADLGPKVVPHMEKAKKAAEAAWLAIPRASHVPATLFRLIPTRSCAVSLK